VSVTIERCAPHQADELVRFIDDEWERGHVLASSRALLDWQYKNGDGSYSFLVARQRGTIVGMLGYISTKRYDPSLADANVVWLTTWKVRADANVAGLGLSLLRHVDETERHVAIGAIGFNPATRPMYAALGYRIGELPHYVAVPNRSPAARGLAAVEVDGASQCDGLRISSDRGRVPQKSPRYFRTRYLEHPFYRYRLVSLRDGDACVGLLAVRLAEHDGLRALRIVDFLGDPGALAQSGGAIQSMIREHDAAYADVYNAGIDADVFAHAGFRLVDPDGDTIVPDHFEPFERKNIRLWYAIRTVALPILFKGDADQDRPNRLPSRAA